MANKNKHKSKKHFSMRQFLLHHREALAISGRRLLLAPIASIMTVAVIGLALALPGCLYILLQNVSGITDGWQQGTQISLFLKMNAQKQDVEQLMVQLKLRPDIAEVTYISPQQGLKQLQDQAGFGDALSQLPDNPLPPVIEVSPSPLLTKLSEVQNLLQNLQQIPIVNSAKLDMQWLQRLSSMINLAKRGVYGLVLLLGLAVLLVIGNTIRLSTQNHKREIEVIKLIGATNRFVRRPFLYTGFLYGVLGGLFAWILTSLMLLFVAKPVYQLAGLYQTQFHLSGLGMRHGVMLLVISAVLGFLGSYVAVNRHLSQLDKY